MSEEKFTKGPWFIKQSEAIKSPYLGGNTSSTRITILDAQDGEYQPRHVIAQVAKGNGRGDANAALIAAAPEMYDILKHYFDLIQRADYGDIVAEQKIFENIVYIEGVLQKAKGEG